MHIAVVGLSHRTAPLEVREKLSISEQAMESSRLYWLSCDLNIETEPVCGYELKHRTIPIDRFNGVPLSLSCLFRALTTLILSYRLSTVLAFCAIFTLPKFEIIAGK